MYTLYYFSVSYLLQNRGSYECDVLWRRRLNAINFACIIISLYVTYSFTYLSVEVVCGCDSLGGVGAAVVRQGEYDDSATTATSPAASSCGSLTESDVFTAPRNCPLDDEATLRSDYDPPRRPDDSWKALTQHVIGGGYQIRPPHRLHEYSPSDVDDYR